MDQVKGGPEIDSYRALVLHGNQVVVDLIRLTLNHGLFVVQSVRDQAGAEAALAAWHPHMAIVDMDHQDGAVLLERLRTVRVLGGSATPVLGLTRRGDLASKLYAFELGVDDILTVPFSPEELLARSIVMTRRAMGTDRPVVTPIRLGEIEVDILGRLVRVGPAVIHLSVIEQSLLYLLASRSGRVVSRETILDMIWGIDFVAESNVVDRHIRSLRIKLRDDFQNPSFIATVPGEGYKFLPTFSDRGWTTGSGGEDTGI